MSESRRGLVYGITAYVMWGSVPAFWKLLIGVSPIETLAHRVVWGVVALGAIVAATGAGPALRRALADRKTVGMMALSGALLVINWGVFIAAVVAGRLLDASLGYFMNPLISIAFGTIVLRERLRRLQWIAIALAVVGVAIQTWRAGHVPWISLVLASSFGAYGAIRKVARVESLAGAAIETAVIAPIAAIYLAVLAAHGGGQLGHASVATQLLLISTGIVTVAPLLLFTSAARRLPLSTLGFLQYLGPTGQFVLAVPVYGEAFTREQLLAFGFIWAALAVFSVDLVRQAPRRPLTPQGVPRAEVSRGPSPANDPSPSVSRTGR
ncbi:MAG TPA: EamA family transporter RarD [Kofleriaceae bacterium]|nr:EamA family transporter RarD [Kofleriaceae bacterium]